MAEAALQAVSARAVVTGGVPRCRDGLPAAAISLLAVGKAASAMAHALSEAARRASHGAW